MPFSSRRMFCLCRKTTAKEATVAKATVGHGSPNATQASGSASEVTSDATDA